MEPIDLDFDANMEPFRGRSNTWPLPRPDVSEFADDVKCDMDSNEANGLSTGMIDPSVMPQTLSHSGHDSSSSPLDQSMVGSGGPKKNTSRRNAWGNMSYADLITQAINGSPEKRLTLSQIYDWMVQNVPYFKDKGDSNSSAGWKNSIRHNLSLHNRFMRVQNEGTGKSSWWMINPDAKPGKAARRRATSMETQKYEKKRGRVKKKIEALKNGLNVEHTTPSPSSSVSEGLDTFPESPIHHTFQLSPEFRSGASSNANPCGNNSLPGLDILPESPLRHSFQLSPEFRPRASSNASSCGNNTLPGLEMFPDSPLRHTFQSSPEFRPRASSNASSCGNNPLPNDLELNLDSLALTPVPVTTSSSVTSLGTTASLVMDHLLSFNNPMPNDLDLSFDTLQGGLECDVDSVIRHELSVDGSLDFNFDPMHHSSNPSQTSMAHNSTMTMTMTNTPSSRSYVHFTAQTPLVTNGLIQMSDNYY